MTRPCAAVDRELLEDLQAVVRRSGWLRPKLHGTGLELEDIASDVYMSVFSSSTLPVLLASAKTKRERRNHLYAALKWGTSNALKKHWRAWFSRRVFAEDLAFDDDEANALEGRLAADPAPTAEAAMEAAEEALMLEAALKDAPVLQLHFREGYPLEQLRPLLGNARDVVGAVNAELAAVRAALGLTGGPVFRGNVAGGNGASRSRRVARTADTASGRAAMLVERLLASEARTVNDLRAAAFAEGVPPRTLDVVARLLGVRRRRVNGATWWAMTEAAFPTRKPTEPRPSTVLTNAKAKRRDEWRPVVEAWRASGLSVAAYARQIGVRRQRLDKWIRKVEGGPIRD